MSNDPVRPGEELPPLPPLPSPRGVRLQAALVLVMVSLVSFLAGAALDRWYLHRGRTPGMRGGPPSARMMREPRPSPSERMARELALSDSQRVQVDSIIARQSREMRALMEEGRPRVDSVLARTREAIGRVLTEDQRVKFDSLVKARERDAPWSRRRRGGGGYPNGGMPPRPPDSVPGAARP